MPELQGQLRGHREEGIIVQSFFVIVGRGEVLSEALVQLFQIYY